MSDCANYLPVVLRVARALDLAPGAIRHITVLHDQWCALLAGNGPCNCSPDVVLGRPGAAVRA